MEILKDYAEVLKEIEYINEQIKYTQFEMKWWFGVDPATGKGTPLDAVGVYKFGVESAMVQQEKKRRALNNLNDRLEIAENKRNKIEDHLKGFDGLEYKVAYLKYIAHKTLPEIADELGYSYSYIKKVSMKIGKRNRKGTDLLKTV